MNGRLRRAATVGVAVAILVAACLPEPIRPDLDFDSETVEPEDYKIIWFTVAPEGSS